jgi:glucosamine-6-phosphate deaminase
MNIIIFQSYQEMSEAGATIIVDLLKQKPKSVLGLATGGTPVGIYEQLNKMYSEHKVSFKEATSFNLDEYIGIPQDHPESYYSYMQHHLFQHIDLPAQQAFIPNSSAENLNKECERYDLLIQQIGQIDLQILGIGHNGHIGFNEPAQGLLSGTHIVKLSKDTRRANARFFDKIEQVPEFAITMGVGTILKAKQILLIVKGADKADIVERALTCPITTELPASLLQTHSNLTVLVTEEAVTPTTRERARA